jgi:hypothetical protein
MVLLFCLATTGCAAFRLQAPDHAREAISPDCQHKADLSFRLSIAAAVMGGCGTAAGSLGGLLTDSPRVVLGMQISGASCAAAGGVLGLLSTYYAAAFSRCSK